MVLRKRKSVLKSVEILLLIPIFSLITIWCTSPRDSNNKPDEKPNVIVIFTDDMNFEDIGALGGNVLTPTIDHLMNEGIYFTHFYDCSAVCSPSRYNLLTGRYASRSKALLDQYPTSDPAFLRWNVDIDKGERTIAHVMKENGYYTGMVGKYHNLQNEQLQDQMPEDADAGDPEIQKRINTNYTMLKELVQETSGFDYLENVYINNLHALALPKTMQHHNMEWVTQGALDFIEKADDNPFFLYFATTLPHDPAPIKSMYADPKITPSGMLDKAPQVQPDRMDVINRVKKAGLPEKTAPYTWLDDGIGALIEKLEERNLLANTIIVFASDHGGNKAKMTCYEKGVRAPAFIYWENHLKPGKKVDGMVANIDIAPTIYDLCGITIDESEKVDGKSLVPLLNGTETAIHESLLLEITYSKAVVTKDWKYIAVRFPDSIQQKITPENNNQYNQEGTLYSANNPERKAKVRYHADKIYPAYFDRDQLFYLAENKKEQVNLADNPAYKEKLEEMKGKLKAYVEDFPHSFGEFDKK
jgi:arylsulfatase A-like enzyme